MTTMMMMNSAENIGPEKLDAQKEVGANTQL
jgi:hypothetical protein